MFINGTCNVTSSTLFALVAGTTYTIKWKEAYYPQKIPARIQLWFVSGTTRVFVYGPYTPTVDWSDRKAYFTMSTSGSFQLTISTIGSIGSVTLIDKIQVTSAASSYAITTECSRSPQVTVTVLGRNFGPSGAAIRFGGSTCQAVHDPESVHTRASCLIPPGLGLVPVTVMQAGTVASPQVLSITYSQCPRGHAGLNCALCPAGTSPDPFGVTPDEERFCLNCPRGRYGLLGDCIACPIGRYGPQEQQTVCLPCQPGLYSDAAAKSACLECPNGHFMAEENATICEACSPGRFLWSWRVRMP